VEGKSENRIIFGQESKIKLRKNNTRVKNTPYTAENTGESIS
jgi:hypothetical protein